MQAPATPTPRRPWWGDAYLWITLTFAAIAGMQPLRSFDLFWHLATGRYIVAKGGLPATDPFRFTSNHAPWVDHSWLSQLVFYGIERAFGTNGLVVLGMLVTVAIVAVMTARFRSYGLPRSIVALVVVLAIFGARPRLMLRPELTSLLFLALLIPLLERFSAGKSWKNATLLAVLVAIWANFHPGALVAPVIAAAFLLGCKLQRAAGSIEGMELRAQLAKKVRGLSQRMTWLHIVAFPALLAAAVLATPTGVEIYTIPFKIQQALEGLPVVNPEWLPVWQSAWQAYAVGLALLMACVGWAAWKGGVNLPGLFVGVVLATLAASGARHQGVFFVGAAFVAARAVASIPARRVSTTVVDTPEQAATIPHAHGLALPLVISRFASPIGRGGRIAISAAAVAVPVALGAWCVAPPARGPLQPRQAAVRTGLGIEPGLFPEGAIQFVQAHPEIGPLYDDVAFGGYLLWRLYPERQVFWDGRNEVDSAFLREATMARSNEKAWVALLDRFGIDAAIVHYREGRWRVVPPGGAAGQGPEPVYRTASQVHFPRDRFALVQWDDAGMLFVRRTPARASWLATEEFVRIHPEAIEETLAEASSSLDRLQSALAELDRHDRRAGPCNRSNSLRAELLRRNGAGIR